MYFYENGFFNLGFFVSLKNFVEWRSSISLNVIGNRLYDEVGLNSVYSIL